jgi:uncharacterized LabA/DUF88 family protein
MSFLSSPYNGPLPVSYLFVDGAYLRNVLERFEREVYQDLPVAVDYRRLSGSHTKVFYYDCPPTKRQQETDEEFLGRERLQAGLYRHLRSLRGWHIYEGVVKGTGRRARQKEVDILIAVDMLTHAYRRNMNGVAFLAGDQDFRPLIDALVRDGMFIELMYDPSSISSELADAADSRVPLDPYRMFEWLEDGFKKAYPLPERSGGSEKMSPPSAPLAVGLSDWGTVELFHDGSQFVIIQPHPGNTELFLRMRHPNRDFLQRVHAKTYAACEWSGGA